MTDAGNDAVAEFAGRISALHRQTESARAALADTTGTAGSPDGAVRVRVDTAGVLTGIEFGPAARDLPAGELAKTVLRTVRQARVAVLREAERLVADAVGEFSEGLRYCAGSGPSWRNHPVRSHQHRPHRRRPRHLRRPVRIRRAPRTRTSPTAASPAGAGDRWRSYCQDRLPTSSASSGINWPNVNEDKVREFGQHVAQFGPGPAADPAGRVGHDPVARQAYQGAGYEQLLATWGAKSESHMSELLDGCHWCRTRWASAPTSSSG